MLKRLKVKGDDRDEIADATADYDKEFEYQTR